MVAPFLYTWWEMPFSKPNYLIVFSIHEFVGLLQMLEQECLEEMRAARAFPEFGSGDVVKLALGYTIKNWQLG